MSTPTGTLPLFEPLPTIHLHYRSVANSCQGRLSARMDDTALHLQFSPLGHRDSRLSIAAQWRVGPVRTCHRILEALQRALTLLGEEPNLARSLQLGWLIDHSLGQRLEDYAALKDGDYERLARRVAFLGDSPGGSCGALTLSMGWIAARTTGVTYGFPETGDKSLNGYPVRETFVLIRQQKRWELWARLERANSGSMPCRRYARLCRTDLLAEEPALAAELLLYVALSRSGRGTTGLSACVPDLISPERLERIAHSLGSLEKKSA